VALGDTQACVSGAISGEPFVACDAVNVFHSAHLVGCGVGPELALLVPLLGALRGRRRAG
jgi:hypothetical protein